LKLRATLGDELEGEIQRSKKLKRAWELLEPKKKLSACISKIRREGRRRAREKQGKVVETFGTHDHLQRSVAGAENQ